ncbi:Metacaspase-2 [Hibiscus syriacus]|uniref:Metacaspase-2 n=1 Tax=Hibiscus syriacus TaxID=106335 RepID=A0A6A2WQ28_HIBSY|nr:Metacaspase-2 [Hibiscus syriacus]
MLMLVNCSNNHAPLQLPPAAKSIRCVLCQAITLIADPRSLPFRPSSSTHTHAPPSPYNHAPPGPPPQVHGRKRAVICGVSYKNTQYEVNGCINDANCMKFLLVRHFNFPESSIITLTEEETDPYKRPTKHNIRMALRWLVQGCQPGDSLVFHYSGHGSQQKDDNGDEVNGYDETLCPSDFESQGMIVDDEINATIVRSLPHGVKLHAIVDACHSGTVLDLPFLCKMDRKGRYVWEDHRPRTGMWKEQTVGKSFPSADVPTIKHPQTALSKITSTGAMTYSFIEAIKRGHATTYGNMLSAMQSNIRNADDGGFVTSLITMLLSGGSLGGGLRQEPQLTLRQEKHNL